MENRNLSSGPMLNAYPDSIGGTLEDIVEVLKTEDVKGAFDSFYILPSVFNTDLDRGFSVIDYSINEQLASRQAIEDIKNLGVNLKLDFILNHLSVLSPQFQDIIENGEESKYKDFFINWNKFWDGHGKMTEDGYIQPDPEVIKDMFFRKPGLPILMVRFPDGKDVPYWNTFYQEVRYDKVDAQDLMKMARKAGVKMQYITADTLAAKINAEIENGKKPSEMDFTGFENVKDIVIDGLEASRKYLGQMDLNIQSDLVWEYYDTVLKTLAEYGAKIVRLDAFAYAPKAVGEKNFMNEPSTWETLQKVQDIADKYSLSLLPEIHASYGEKTYETLAGKGYMTYDFFLPGLLIDALESQNGQHLADWALEMKQNGIDTVNMLGCHDGIPLLDLKGILPEERIQKLIDIVVGRGGYVKDLHGAKNMYYQVNATYYSALGEDDKKMLLARAIQMFMPGKPQVWYLDLFLGKNDHEAVKRAGVGGHKEINRTNLSPDDIRERLTWPAVQEQLKLLKFRKECPAFGFDADFEVQVDGSLLTMTWENQGAKATLKANLADYSYKIVTE
ncbi:MAG: glycosidase [Lachnospiraceae bacterium]|nr:glycosidase [Lachnospiraceae bacterium]